MTEESQKEFASVSELSTVELAIRDHSEILNDFLGRNLTQIFIDFAESLGAHECPFCSGTGWDVCAAPPNSITGVKLFSVTPEGKEFVQFVPSVISNCMQCGFQRSHHTEAIHKWWKSQPQKPQGGQIE